MRVDNVEEIIEPGEAARVPQLCKTCSGRGWRWSELGFGDLCRNRTKQTCSLCGGTGTRWFLQSGDE